MHLRTSLSTTSITRLPTRRYCQGLFSTNFVKIVTPSLPASSKYVCPST